ncbi:response regulator [Siphonobacter curvatus]|uniref:Response regulator rcp1 n=1 Tax=Siphonobacter curvatus TaxID=2094562 RepID=A0A2S7IEL4_9BACT|nr:response regulator [Siphonobacter curvatus]PQA53202.1 response regulator rcp1 [Siphonobacter curvatus]
MHTFPLVLIVDDDEDDQEFLKIVAEQSAFPGQLLFAQDGRQALELLASQQPDLVISDVNMPRMNGLELLAHLKTSTQWQQIPFILLTTNGSQEASERAYAQGVTQFLSKPSSQTELAQLWKQLTHAYC